MASQTDTSGFYLLIVLNLVVILALLYYHLRHLRAKQSALETFSRRLIESQETERKRIAHELHDSLGQGLLVIKNQTLMALRENSGPGRERLLEISSAASQAIEEVRTIAYALRPYQLDRLGLTRALESLVRRVESSCDIRFVTHFDLLDGLFPRDCEVSLFRIVQESVNNIVRHAAATEASVEIFRHADSVSIRIADNGCGFAYDPASTGLGLMGITERVHLLGGTSQIVAVPHTGTTITIHIRREEQDHVRGRDGADCRRPSDLPQGAVASSGG